MLTAITRQVSPEIVHCELTHLERIPIDYALAVRQHRRYEDALTDVGCQLVSLEADPDLADSVFVEDVAVVLDEFAILGRPAPESRRAEVDRTAGTLAEYRELRTIEPPGTLEGGDVLRLGRQLYVGRTSRTNQQGIDQLRQLAEGYTVVPVQVSGCLHLKSAATQADPETVLINPDWVDGTLFRGMRLLEVDPAEPRAGNGLLVGTGFIYSDNFPRTAERLAAQGVQLELIDLSELQKAEGAVTCCSLVFHTGG